MTEADKILEMIEADKILEMIEEVGLSDTDALNEIDARFFAYLTKQNYRPFNEVEARVKNFGKIPRYSTSRDALKAIRPEGWWFDIGNLGSNGNYVWRCRATHEDTEYEIEGEELLKEELAELHSIIQAIQWEREND